MATRNGKILEIAVDRNTQSMFNAQQGGEELTAYSGEGAEMAFPIALLQAPYFGQGGENPLLGNGTRPGEKNPRNVAVSEVLSQLERSVGDYFGVKADGTGPTETGLPVMTYFGRGGDGCGPSEHAVSIIKFGEEGAFVYRGLAAHLNNVLKSKKDKYFNGELHHYTRLSHGNVKAKSWLAKDHEKDVGVFQFRDAAYVVQGTQANHIVDALSKAYKLLLPGESGDCKMEYRALG